MNKKSTLSKLLKELGNYRLLLLLSIVLSCLTVVLTLYIPILCCHTFSVLGRNVTVSVPKPAKWYAK